MGAALTDKVIFVTGAGSGIGRSAALAIAAEGAKLVLADINAEGLAEVVGEIEAAGGDVVAVTGDVSVEDDAVRMIATAVERFGRLDGAFNNAGIGPKQAPTAEIDLADWSRVIGVNLTGPMLCTKYEIRAMLEGGRGGSIVNMASTAGLLGVPGQAAYAATKHGVLGLTKTSAAEYGSAGIRVNAICPGAVATPATLAFGFDWNEIVPSPMGRIVSPEEVAEVAIWLLSAKSSFVTGQSITIDGGRSSTNFVPPAA